MEVVDSSPEYKTIFEYCPAVLRVIHSIEVGAFITCRALREVLQEENCVGGHCYGSGLTGSTPTDYICHLTCRRTCLRCVPSPSQYSPLDVNARETGCRALRQMLQGFQLPMMRNVPGLFGRGVFTGFSRPTRETLVDHCSAERILALRTRIGPAFYDILDEWLYQSMHPINRPFCPMILTRPASARKRCIYVFGPCTLGSMAQECNGMMVAMAVGGL
jgi:hypothetical protein